MSSKTSKTHTGWRMNTPLALRAAQALDRSHEAASLEVGAYTPKIRDTLATWLDGRAPKLRTSTVRKCCAYLELIAR